MRRFAISDIHGCRRTFEALLDQIAFSTEDELFLLGDYIDRGADSRGVLDLILKLQEEGYRLRCLRGNHEALLLDGLGGLADKRDVWMGNGGGATLSSFGLPADASPRQIPGQYIDFLDQLEWHVETDGYILVHAGLDFGMTDPLDNRFAMIWIRNWHGQINPAWLQGRAVVHGHTPIPRPMIVKQLKNLEEVPALDIDAGCVFKSNYLNQLCAFDLDNRQLFFQKNIENK